MKILKRQLALLLALAMTLTMLQIPVLATEATEPESQSTMAEAAAEEPLTSEPVTDVPGDEYAPEPVEEPEPVAGTEVPAGDDEAEENVVSDTTTEVEEAEASGTEPQEEVTQTEPETEPAPFAAFSMRGTAADTECDHAETDIAWDTTQTITYTSVNDTQHKVTGYQYTYCTSCFEHVGESFAAEELESHDLKTDGSCALCGYGSGCQHTSAAGTWNYGSTPPSFSQYSDTQHLVTGYQRIYCASCYETLTESVYKENLPENHYMIDGKCGYCAYTCPHTNTETVWDSDEPVTYAQYSSTQHKYQGYQYTYCTYCLTHIGESVAAEKLENHILNDNGTCTQCYYNAACEHEVTWEIDPTIRTHGIIDDNQHRVEYFRYPYCAKCEEIIGDSIRFPQIVENHSFGDDDWCDICGFRRNCPHDNVRIETNAGRLPGYRSVSSTQHVMFGYEYDRCWDCDKRISEDRAVDSPYILNHTFDASGVCTACGYDSNNSSGCAHKNTEVLFYEENPIRYAQVDAEYHNIYRKGTVFCDDCRTDIGDSNSEMASLESHTLNDAGSCVYCGYGLGEDYCTHPNSQLLLDADQPKAYYYKDETQHRVNYYQYHYCPDCDSRISESFLEAAWEDHAFDSAGACALCGYGCGEDSCAHPATDVMWDTSLGLTYTSLDENQHEVAGYKYHYCTSCFKHIGDSFPVTEQENHSLDSSGDCTLCNYRTGCTHSETTKKLYSTLYDALSSSSHEVTRLYSKVCADPDCGKVLVSVETSYTEMDIEKHDFDGNVCRLCNYTVADQLRATVSASGPTANKGDRISATVSVVGGAGGYRYSWKILKDGTVVSESPISSSASCDTSAREEGSFVFQVTVTDSSGNTVTAQSGAITVKHSCQYKTITDTVLVIESATHHSVQTTTYDECTTCHAQRNKQTSVDLVTHTPVDANSFAYEGAHPHKMYFICECGAHPYLEDQFHTANGVVQEPDVCCICHGHVFGDPAAEDDGKYYKTCANCHLKQLVAVSAEPEDEVAEETHLHSYNVDSSEAAVHPHPYTAKCSCGASETYYQWDFTCCQCTGEHAWCFVRLTDGKTYMQVCENCGATQSATPTAQVQDYYKVIDIITYRHNVAKKYQDEHDVDSSASAIWKTIADQATQKLMDADFVTMNETLNTASKYASITGLVEAVYGAFTKDTWDEQQTDLWETLLLRMLTEYYENDLAPAIEYKDNANDALKIVKKVTEKAGEQLSDNATYTAMKGAISEIDDWINMLENQITISYNKGNNLDALADQEKLEKLKALKKKYDDKIKTIEHDQEVGAELTKAAENVGLLMDCISVLAEGTSAAQAVAERNNAFAQMLIHSDQCIAVLENVRAAADASGNQNLTKAAEKIIQELEAEMEKQTNQFLSETEAFLSAVRTKAAKIAVEDIAEYWIEAVIEKENLLGSTVKDLGSVLSVLKLGATGMKSVLDWGDAYDAAQKLMTVNQMDATMNITQVLKENDAPYMLKLWGLLQAEGCERAQEFLSAWEDGTGLNSSDLGIDNGGLFDDGDLPKVLREIQVERNYYITALKLPLEKVNG